MHVSRNLKSSVAVVKIIKVPLKSGSSHLLQEFDMRSDSISYFWVFNVRNAILFANLFNDTANSRIMNM